MDIAITGSHGFIGGALSRALAADGHRVRPLPRTVEPDDIDGAEAIVNLAGASIGGVFTSKHKAEVLDSRLRTTASLVDAIGRLDRRPAVLVSGSAIGVYGADRGDDELTEGATVGTDYLAEVCVRWEAAAAAATDLGVRVALARTGLVLASGGGALKAMVTPFKLGLGGPTGPGTQWMSWITLDDEVAAIRHLIDNPISGAVNLTAPGAVRNAEWADTLGKVLHRPARLRLPKALAKLPGGVGEMVDNLLLASQRVVPGVLVSTGFRFGQPELEPALQAVLVK